MRIRSLILVLIAVVMGGGVLFATLAVVLLTGLSRAEHESGTASVDFQRIEGLVRNSNELLGMLDILTSETSGAFPLVERLSLRCRDDIRFVGSLPRFSGTDYGADLEALMEKTLDSAASVQTANDPYVAMERYDEAAFAFMEELEWLETQTQSIATSEVRRIEQQRRVIRITLVIAAMLYITLVAVISYWILGRLVTPVQRLVGAAERSMLLDAPFRLEPNGPREVQDLTKAVGAFVISLESRVNARTTELAEARDEAIKALIGERCVAADLELANEELEQLATTDKLTGLPNRTVFNIHLDQTLKRSRRTGERFAVLFFDFDRFKVVNDSLGHTIGDKLLCAIAARFRRELRESDSVARFGGDEFLVLLSNLTKWSDAELKANRLLEVFARPHQLGDHLIVSNASIGIVTNEYAYEQPGEMIRDADAAMYQAKENGRAQVVLFDAAMHAEALDRLSLEADLGSALENGQFRLVYQPIVGLETGEVSGFEALIRWDHPERGIVGPIQFIPIAEETGLIVEIGQWVLRTACRQIADWNRRLGLEANLTMSVNVSKRQLLGSSFVDDVLECLREFDVPAETLTLELTESVISDERCDVATLLAQLREHGLHIALDDFGTGVSSLSALHEFPIDVLKIDQAFIRDLDGNHSLLAVVASITSLAENLGVRTVVEGIETVNIIGALQSIGCTWGQGYYFAKPLTPADAEAYVLGIHKEKCGA